MIGVLQSLRSGAIHRGRKKNRQSAPRLPERVNIIETIIPPGLIAGFWRSYLPKSTGQSRRSQVDTDVVLGTPAEGTSPPSLTTNTINLQLYSLLQNLNTPALQEAMSWPGPPSGFTANSSEFRQGFLCIVNDVHTMRFAVIPLEDTIKVLRTEINTLDRTITKLRGEMSLIKTAIKNLRDEPTIISPPVEGTLPPESCLTLTPGTVLIIDDIVQFSWLLPPDAYYSCQYNNRAVQIRFEVSRLQGLDATGVGSLIVNRVRQVFQIPDYFPHDDIWALCVIRYAGETV
ncbi:hypothetical protein NW768_004822 [Fusarium equiseti]|uniref:Uncharacterized protein n=1 Tax=Fusarium equiseti TaxID=61235 RepID=A0ABQ8RHG6_FUSEQ|nr:hypothetical protein NW768_004822 [Fusarium equiseti]